MPSQLLLLSLALVSTLTTALPNHRPLHARSTAGHITIPSLLTVPTNIYAGAPFPNTTHPYTTYGCAGAAFPPQSSWLSFVDLFNLNKPHMFASCTAFSQPNPSGPEIGAIWDAVQSVAAETGLDHRFILAVILQESGGCPRAPTTNYGVRNPGLMQTHDGAATCNSDLTGLVSTPCPDATITAMVREGVAGTAAGDGLAQCVNEAVDTYGAEGAMAYYSAARIYNSGSVGGDGCLEGGIATHCYASDVANRLLGWTGEGKTCWFDGA